MRRRRPPPACEDVRVVHGVAPPGASAITFGRTVFVRRDANLSPRLQRHEFEHVLQYHRLGRIGFLRRYLWAYLRWRVRRYGHWPAYRRIPMEIQAEWRARRDMGLGVIDQGGSSSRASAALSRGFVALDGR